ncbi:ABC transporter permease [Pseudomonas lopnurensis]|uniref:ABC transporter permease n=1 Tax=Pseudomonas lopnurensis TaxID=1477517 RepID=UPI00187A2DA6|nr:ABC transporter permease [Pseudomonas lopnurensis]MBE7375705.1 ABC transporter permease [Pseudomonas lopnurensis]
MTALSVSLGRRTLARPGLLFGAGFLLLLTLLALAAPWLAPHDPNEQDLLNVLLPPLWATGGSLDYPLGTDALGQCVLSRLLYGARVVVIIMAIAPLGAALIGCLLALLGGYFGGWLDWLVERFVDLWLSFPAVLLALILMVALSPGVQNVILAIVFVDWARFCRVLRAEVLLLRRRSYVAASRIGGAGALGIIWRDILPGLLPTLIVLMAMEFSIAVVAESVLSFAGMSAAPQVPTWGGMIADGMGSLYSSPYPLLLPVFCMILTVLAATFLGQGLREAVDVRLLERAGAA